MNIFLYEFLEDMVDVGVSVWGLMAIVFAAFTYFAFEYAGWIAQTVGVIMVLNLVFATGVTIWWSGRGDYW
jgi:hypothetical protein